MQEDKYKKISQLIDGELDNHQSLSLLKKLQDDEVLQDKQRRYHIVSQLLKAQQPAVADSDFVNRVAAQLQDEPVYLRPPQPIQFNWKQASLALAASVAILAVVVTPKLMNHKALQPSGAALVVAQQDQQHSSQLESMQQTAKLTSPQARAAYVNQRYPVTHRFNDYLQAHSNSVYTIGASVYQPYAQTVGYRQER